MGRWLGGLALVGVSLLGLAVLTLPLWFGQGEVDPVSAGMGIPLPTLGLPLLVAGLGLCLLALTVEASAGLGPRGVALIAVLAAINSVLRVAEVIVPGPGGFSPVFVLIILAGYVHGVRFGFLVGVFTLVVSALATGFVDPWLPAQAIVAGWVGASAGLVPVLGRRREGRRTNTVLARPEASRSALADAPLADVPIVDATTTHSPIADQPLADPPSATRAEVIRLAAFGALWGFLYGALLSLPFWTVLEAGRPSDVDGGLTARVMRFGAYYGVSSLTWDAFRAAGNVALILLIGRPAIVALRRVGAWFAPEIEHSATGIEVVDDRRIEPIAPTTPVAPVAPTTSIAPTPSIAPTLRVAPVAPPPPNAPTPQVAPTTPTPPMAPIPPVPTLPTPPPDPLHSRAWAVWLGAALALGALATNLFVLAGGVLAIEVVRSASASRRRGAGPDLPIWRLISVIVLVSALYNVLFAHTGDTVLARLPRAWPLIGGVLTAEALVYGAMNGLRLSMLILAFVTFQTALSARQLVRLIPRAFGTIALVTGVALTWVPATRSRAAEVREAAIVRGLSRPGMRGWLPLAMPMLVGGLERAMGLAEAMTARGITVEHPPAAARFAMPAGSAALVGAGIAVQVGGEGSRAFAALLAGVGVTLVTVAIRSLSKNTPRTSYREARWRAADTLVVLAALLPIAAAFVPDIRSALRFSPYPRLELPSAEWPVTVPIVGLALPALFVARARAKERARHVAERADDDPRRFDIEHGDDASLGPDVGRDDDVAHGHDVGRADDIPRVRDIEHGVNDAHAPSIRFRDFSVDYPTLGGRSRGSGGHDLRAAVRGVDVTMPGGGLTLVAGPSGAGKSTLLRATCGLVPHFSGGAVRGSVRVGGRGGGGWDPVALGPASMSGRVGFVGGDPARGFVVDRVADEVAFALEHRALPAPLIRQRVASALEAVGILHLAQRRIETLSGGERQRVAIAAALALAPPALVLDEPTSQLDDAAAALVLGAIRRIMQDGRRTIVISEHRLDRVLALADHAVWLPGPCAAPFEGPPGEIARRIPRIAIPEPPEGVREGGGPPALEFSSVRFGYPAPAVDAVSGSQARGVEGAARNPIVIRDLSLRVGEGEIVALTGPSGCGKTTILRLAVGLLRPDAGRINVLGQAIDGIAPAEICRRVGYVPQDPDALLSAESVRAELEQSRDTGRHGPESIDAILTRFGIGHLAGRYPRDLSAGERLRVALAAVMLDRPSLLLLDEPTRGLDDRALADLAGLLHEMVSQGHSVLLATHDRRLIGAAHREAPLECSEY